MSIMVIYSFIQMYILFMSKCKQHKRHFYFEGTYAGDFGGNYAGVFFFGSKNASNDANKKVLFSKRTSFPV